MSIIDNKVMNDLFNAFPHAFINHNLEFIATGCGEFQRANVFICLGSCENRDDVRAKLLEWMSRDASCSMPYKSDRRNKELHDYVRKGINDFLRTTFTSDDMDTIYCKLGNAVNHNLTMRFIDSGYCMNVLDE